MYITNVVINRDVVMMKQSFQHMLFVGEKAFCSLGPGNPIAYYCIQTLPIHFADHVF